MWSQIFSLFLSVALTISVSVPVLTPEEDFGEVTPVGGEWNTEAEEAERFLQAYLDITYKADFGSCPDFYSRDEAREMYDSNIEAESDFFVYGFGVSSLEDMSAIVEPSESQRRRVEELYREIYARTDYTVGSAVRQKDGSFAVELSIRPLDLIKLLDENFEAGFEGFWNKFDAVDTESMSDEEFEAWYVNVFASEYYDTLLDFVEVQLPSMGYLEEQDLLVVLRQDTDGRFQFRDEDLLYIDERMIDYRMDFYDKYDQGPQEIAIFPLWTAVELSLNKEDITFFASGETYQFRFYDYPMHAVSNRFEGDVAWTSSDPMVAAVSWDGLVTAVGPGICTVTATLEGLDGEVKLDCTVRCNWK